MPFEFFIWDLDDDPDGNTQHIAEHGVTKDDVEEVVENARDVDVSHTSGRPAIFGETTDGRYLIVVYERVDENTIYPVTAYEVPREGESWPNE